MKQYIYATIQRPVATIIMTACVAHSAAISAPPNVIVIIADDLGYADVGFNGCQDFETPHIDRIAGEGVRCSNGYVSYPVCGPSRAGLMTGRYQDRFGFCDNPIIDLENPAAGLPLTETTIAEALRPANYRSMAIGKWHLGCHPTLHPLERGFHEFFGFLSGGHDYFPENLTLHDLSDVKQMWDWYRTKLLRNHQRVDIDEYLTDELSNEAVAFVERTSTQPFFLYLAYNAPHTPLQATAEYLDRVSHIEDQQRRTYAAMVTAMDDGVGRLLDRLDTLGLAKNTLVFFLSDNGGPLGHNGSNNGPLRGGKGTQFEGGIRVPFAVRWPAKLPAGTEYHKPVISLDILATIAAHAGVAHTLSKPLDGVDLVPFLSGADPAAPHDRLFWRSFHQQSIATRSGNEKLIVDSSKDSAELYDLASDIGEQTNVAVERPDIVNNAMQEIEDWTSGMVGPAFPGLMSWQPHVSVTEKEK